MWSLSSSTPEIQLPCQFGQLVILEQSEVISHDHLARGVLQAEMAQLEQQALLQVTRRHTHRVERVHQCENSLTSASGQFPITAIS